MSETSDDIAIRFEQGGHRAIALTDATCNDVPTPCNGVQPPLSAEEFRVIRSYWVGAGTITEQDQSALFDSHAALAARCAALEGRVGALSSSLRDAIRYTHSVPMAAFDQWQEALAAPPPAQRAPAAATGEGE